MHRLPPSLANHLSSHRHEAIHVSDIGLTTAPDKVIWSRATAIGAVLVTKDEDFVMMRALDNQGPPVVWLRTGNTTKRALISRFTEKLPALVQSLERGDTIIEISDH
jgi:predicted nuclease of predicted toxin-antitoxin system